MDTSLQLLRLDTARLAVNKPAGSPLHRTACVGPAAGFLVDRLRAQVPGALHPAHRLDRPTSGIPQAARSATCAAA